MIELGPLRQPWAPLLAERDRDFLRERAYLAQSTMARLLETYEESDRRGDSALTRFVNELLGLESLDALISGLEPARDVRRIRKLVPEFADLEEELDLLRTRAEDTGAELSRATRDHAALSAKLDGMGDAPKEMPALGFTTALLDRIRLLETQLRSAKMGESIDVVAVEARLHAANSRLDGWRSTSLPSLQLLMDEVAAFSGSDTELSAEPGVALRSLDVAEGLVRDLLERANARAIADRNARARLLTLGERIDAARDAVSKIDAEIADTVSASDSAGLAEALTALSAFVDDDVCPVCGRDYGELHRDTLSEHLSARISEFGAMASRLAVLSERRTEQRARLDQLVTEQTQVFSALEPEHARESLSVALSSGNDLLAKLAGVRQGIVGVARDVDERIKLETSLAAHRADADLLGRLRSELSAISVDAGLRQRHASTDPVSRQIEELRLKVEDLHRAAEAELGAYRERLATSQALEARARDLSELRQSDSSTRRRIGEAENRLSAARNRVRSAAQLSKSAVDLRTSIVEKVFDSTLNGTWRDLFTRLAPQEPYIPEFVASASPASGVGLQAVNKRTGMAGPPGLVLSAGNLNTAALTLFLSLNATATTSVDLLLLDDPVQAMDDIHVAQFSALLRSFARDLGRQVVVAVHERSLFEYLSLELAPARVGEALVTIELAREPSQDTQTHVQRIEYRPDPLEAGLSAA